jgi:sulfofructose kinase
MNGPSQKWDVVGIGENSIDLVAVLPAFPRPGGTLAKLPIRHRQLYCGGQTATAMCTCASLGLRTKYIGVTGNDEHGHRLRAELERRHVDTSDVVVRGGANRFALVLVDESTGERVVLWDADSRLRLRENELPVSDLASARIVHVDDVDEDVALRAAGIARAAGAWVTSDIERTTDRTDALIRSVTHAIFAEPVPARLTGIEDMEAALRALRSRSDAVLCVTLGRRGAMALDGDRLCYAPAFAVRAIDTTGAGDVFRGGFIYALLHDLPLDDALRLGNAAAAASCTRMGAIDGVPSLAEIDGILAGAPAPR